jgi:hypothetical protein
MRHAVIVVLLALVALFALLNWSLITAPTTLSLGFAEVQAPLGLVLLGLLGLITAAFLFYVVYLQSTVLLETRRHARELEASRSLADQAEASRFTELRAYLEGRLREMEGSLSASIGELSERVEGGRAPLGRSDAVPRP